jgi:hypothetical protein
MAFRGQPLPQFLFESKPGMVGGNGYLHKRGVNPILPC